MDLNKETLFDSLKFLEFVRCEFTKRTEENPSYSLRAFAKKLEIHPSCLSIILRGKRPLTQKMMKRLSFKLSMTPAELSNVTMLDEANGQNEMKSFPLEVFDILSQWYYDAILELIQLDDFKPDIHWIASILQISATEVQIAVDRLFKYEFIQLGDQGQWSVSIEHDTLELDGFTSIALAKLQKKALEMSIEAIGSQEIKSRYHSVSTLALEKGKVDEFKNKLRELRSEFCLKTQNISKKFDDVYHLDIGFYSIINKKERK